MALGAQLPVRLEPEVERRLQDIADKTGSSKSALIRHLAKTFTDHIFDAGGKIVLPPDWGALLKPSDGRSNRGKFSSSKGELAARARIRDIADSIRKDRKASGG